jgi:RNA polymerase sigma-70 factor (ECF subfamily)
MKPVNIEKLVSKSQKGDEKSFAELFDIFYEKIFKYIKFRVEEDEVEDLVAKVFLKVVENLKKFAPQKNAGFNAWIFRIAHNTVIDFYRQKRDFLPIDFDESAPYFIEIEDPAPTPNKTTNKNLDSQKIKNLLQSLAPNHREILELKYFNDFSNYEISKITGKTEGNIRVIQLRALREMRKLWPKESL